MSIKLNSIRCKHCNEVLVSESIHDFKICKCGAVSVDGGKRYIKRSFITHPDIDYEELSIIDKEDYNK